MLHSFSAAKAASFRFVSAVMRMVMTSVFFSMVFTSFIIVQKMHVIIVYFAACVINDCNVYFGYR